MGSVFESSHGLYVWASLLKKRESPSQAGSINVACLEENIPLELCFFPNFSRASLFLLLCE